MSKRKVQFSEEVKLKVIDIEADVDDTEDHNEDQNGDEGQANEFGKFGKRFKHTLDSDEEDDEVNEQNYNVLDSDQIDGQEDATIESDGGVAITPFNMKEELETGHFDKEGNYIFDKTEEIRDNWLDGVDWVRLKDMPKDNENDKEGEDEPKAEINLIDVYKQMTELMEPKESVQKAIQRLGKTGGKTKPSDRWKKNKDVELSEAQRVAKEKLSRLSSLADQVLQTGDMDIYDKTFEQLVFNLKKSANSVTTEDDMFADDFDSTKPTEQTSDPNKDSSNEVMWEFRWEDKDSAEVFGPHTSSEMLGWVNDGYFESGVYVRQIGKTDSQFYTSKRIDFELYT